MKTEFFKYNSQLVLTRKSCKEIKRTNIAYEYFYINNVVCNKWNGIVPAYLSKIVRKIGGTVSKIYIQS